MSDRRQGDFPPSINAGRLYERMSSKGNMYLSGRFGSMRITAVKSKEVDDDGHPIWNLMIGEAPRNPAPVARGRKSEAERPREDHGSRPAMAASAPSSPEDQEIPF